MLKFFFIIIILYIIIQQYTDNIDEPNLEKINTETINISKNLQERIQHPQQEKIQHPQQERIQHPQQERIQHPQQEKIQHPQQEKIQSRCNIEEQKNITYDRPNPWTKVIYDKNNEYPYLFHIKLTIPSLNDYQTWKQIIPNIEFNAKTGELIIPSKEESSALALANLICINFSGQMTVENILEKNLIQISVSKARHELVQTKLREQIMENLYGKSVKKVQTNFQKDLANIANQQNDNLDFKSNQFTDTFQYFSEKLHTDTESGIDAYDGSDFSYL
jgi:hypothetical protein